MSRKSKLLALAITGLLIGAGLSARHVHLRSRVRRLLLSAAARAEAKPSRAIRDARWQPLCSAAARPIHPQIYGIGAAQDQHADDEWWISAAARRWGGNPTSRYNWQLGNAWNTASDWYFENVDYVGEPGYSYREFLRRNRAHGMDTALTVPMLGWVAKDVGSAGFSRSHWPVQDQFDPYRPEAGNGRASDAPLTPKAPTETSVAAPPAFVRAWIETIRRDDATFGARSVQQYILDNEPNLWSSTHRDVRPEPLGYDELLARTIAYGSAIRAADPDAVIAGPAEWGWTNYFYSAVDRAQRWHIPWDRLQHGFTPLVPWYLRELARHEQRTGVRVLDVLDLHFYPAAPGVYSPADDAQTSALRIRSTRALWDPTYVDESWIDEPVELLPRMRRWIAENYPGRGLSIGEWSFGAEQHMSGALATAEALGRFGTEGVTSAFYWAFPRAGTPTAQAFRAYRNFDGAGARFLPFSVPLQGPGDGDASAFASRDTTGRHWVFVVLNFDSDTALNVQLSRGSCLPFQQAARAFVYDGSDAGFVSHAVTVTDSALTLKLPAYAIGVIELGTGS